MNVSACIVVYQEQRDILEKAILSFTSISCNKELIIIDNSPKPQLQDFCLSHGVNYLFSGRNLGFGAGHNLGFSQLSRPSDIHLIINPDISFDASEITVMLKWFDQQKNIVLAVPKVLNPDGSSQYICRNIPTPLSMFKRRLNFNRFFEKSVIQDELGRSFSQSINDVPFCHGCFMMFKTDVFNKLGGFDERFFMYMEDADIFFRAKKYGRTVLNPDFSITHEYRKGSSKSIKLLYFHSISAIKFFWKYR